MSLQQNLSSNIKNLRVMRNSSLEDFSAELGIGKTTLQEIESGQSNSTLGTVETIAGNLQISPLALLSSGESENVLALSVSVLQICESFSHLSNSEKKKAAACFERLIKMLER